MNFKDLNLIAPILEALEQKNYTTPTPIQEKSIPTVLAGKDVLGCAQTGTGKTAAFSIPLIQMLTLAQQGRKHKNELNALVLTPTRELAIQIQENIAAYSQNTPIRQAVIFGGVKQHKQVAQIKNGIDILVATPGRLLDLINQKILTLKNISFFVLDEADRMLDMGFIHDIKKILTLLPAKRQSLFFSATMPDNIVQLSNKILTHPVKIEVAPPSTTAETIEQHVYYTNKASKKDLLLHVLSDTEIEQVLLFTKTKHGADRVTKILHSKKIGAAAIHGDKAQGQRQKALARFKNGEIRVLVATDIAARGIDIEKLKHVINYDIPNVAETYVHRIGRCGRAGETGISISISEPEENTFIQDIEKLSKVKLKVQNNHPFPQTERPMSASEKKEFEKEKHRIKMEFIKQKREQAKGKFQKR